MLYALNTSNGTVAWTATTNSTDTPAVANGIVCIGGTSNLHAFNATTGAVLWTATTGPLNSSSPVVANGFVYTGSSDGSVYAFGLP